MSRAGLCTFDDCEIKHITDRGGVLVDIPEFGEVWFYKDMIHENSQIWNREGQKGQLVITEYVAKNKGLI